MIAVVPTAVGSSKPPRSIAIASTTWLSTAKGGLFEGSCSFSNRVPLCVLLLIVVAIVVLRGNDKHSSTLRDPDLEYLKAVNSIVSEDRASGHGFAPGRITEVVPGRVYALSGYEFTEYYFVISKDRRQLISIDAGTRPDFAKGAYEALQAYAPGLPLLTTVLVAHAHWDHVGGHSYFRGLNPRPKFYGRGNYQEEYEKEFNAPEVFAKQFFGERFSPADVVSYKTRHYDRQANGPEHRWVEV